MNDSNDLRRAFEAEEHELRLRQSKVAAILGIVLFPVGILLDWVTYADKLQTLAVIRLVSAGLIAAIYALHFWDRTAAHVRYLTMVGILIAVSGISVIIGITDGAASTYYTGLFLILFAVGVLAPMQPFEATLLCIATLVIYIVGCSFVPNSEDQTNALLNNLYFLVLTCIISVTAVHFNYRRRFNEFQLKYKLAAQHQELSALDRLKSQFFANVSHELRTPLTLILAPVEKLKNDVASLGGTAVELLDVIENNAFRLLRLVNDILGLIRLEEGRASLVKKPIDMAHFLSHTTASMKHLAAMKGIDLNLEEPQGDLWIDADPDALEKIVGNVIANAIKFTPPEGRIDVASAHEGNMVTVRIADTGIGIPPEQLPHIFDRFYQVDGSATRRHQGLGLGLALVRELITRHGGDVAVSSDSGRGTTFVLRFPHVEHNSEQLLGQSEASPDRLANDPLRAFDRKASARALAKEEPAPGRRIAAADVSPPDTRTGLPLLLVVDDEPDMRRYLVTMLRESYRVIEAEDGIGALEKARSATPDLILLDIMLPGVSGLEVCRTLKERPETRAIKIIVLTARADEEAKIVALKNGADDFLIKPFSGIEVRSRIANFIRAAQLERDLQRTNVELKDSLQQLRETEAALVQNARLSALGTMAAGLLHEIGNPLNFMGTALQLAARDPTIQGDPDTADTMKDIQAGYDRIHRVVTDLRGFTAPQKPEHPRPFPIESAIDHALRFTAHVQNGINITRDISQNGTVFGSQSTISQVLVNLIANAVAAVRTVEEQRQPEIRISSWVQGKELFVSVRDNGTGIDPKIQSQIFDPFFSTKDVGEGMGLGLAVSHRIIANHGGSLSVKSSPGEWTEFRFNLPLSSEKEDQVPHGLVSH
ncbi:integral membrane sensor hybrid histidine kinase [Hyphomicrobium denitrificans 1NES1]|uniref:histidine kinase n=1 Tax=Hyphomicrobium denitrificans 1NES1 TaxID=670307 RepID=N0B6Z6_9HYPH|nr:ATP-binding protein [Hyphomicrobium denitrificans]AGK57982.1 integral membrane sensor hybrid histidine kinase [Hyphomicrobium denitrificans 1NES1]